MNFRQWRWILCHAISWVRESLWITFPAKRVVIPRTSALYRRLAACGGRARSGSVTSSMNAVTLPRRRLCIGNRTIIFIVAFVQILQLSPKHCSFQAFSNFAWHQVRELANSCTKFLSLTIGNLVVFRLSLFVKSVIVVNILAD
jgi:hypothetical protein